MESWLSQCRPFIAGAGRVVETADGARLMLPSASSKHYGDAQLDDYAGRSRQAYRHRPPLRLSLRARFSHDAEDNQVTGTFADPRSEAKGAEVPVTLASPWPPRLRGLLVGTAGFGFWNNPFGAQSKVPALPQAIWFFCASPPSNMALALGVPGCGWKAACIDARRLSALAWLPIAPLALPACRSPRLYRRVWPRIQRALGIRESLLAFRQQPGGPIEPRPSSAFRMTDWHTYELEWRRDGARWQVDGQTVLETDRSPRGPLGFVAWIDNQYAVVTPWGKFGFGLLDAPYEQWLEIGAVLITDH